VIEATYDYRDRDGALLFQVVRYVGKDFRQRRPDGVGGWVYKLEGVRRVPYRFPELLAADPVETVYIVEGEKDVESLVRLGRVGTCNPGGAGKWRSVADDARGALADRHVVIIADADDAGRKHAREVFESLRGAGCVELSAVECPSHKDVTDHLAAGRTLAELIALRGAEPEREPWENGPDDRTEEPSPAPEPSPIESRAVLVTSEWFTEEPPPAEWLLKDARTGKPALVRGVVGLLVAGGGAGKTGLCTSLAIAKASGTKWLGVFQVDGPGRVLFLVAEENLAEVKRRVFYAGRGVDPLPAPGVITVVPLDGEQCALLQRPEEYGEAELTKFATDLAAYVERTGPYVLVILDPMSRFSGLETESRNAEATRFIAHMQNLCKIHGSNVLLAHHTNQASRVANGKVRTEATRGVTGITDGARFVATVSVEEFDDPDDAFADLKSVITFAVTKVNGAPTPEPVELRRDETGVLRPLDAVERQIVGKRRAASRKTKSGDVRAAKEADLRAREDAALSELLSSADAPTTVKDIRAGLRAALGTCSNDRADAAMARRKRCTG
jgi:5S rRNA maturation endonuclease (ribonuclease M5)